MKRFAIGSIILISIVLAGCGGIDHPPTYHVEGKLTLKGNPLSAADVTFVPKDTTSRPARGRSDAEGKFTLKTYFGPNTDAEGALAGDYTVVVTKIDIPEGGINPYKQKMPDNQLPQQYSDAKGSPAHATVTAEGPNDIAIAIP